MRPEGWTIIVVIVIALLLFGAPKLPGLARSVGQSLRIFKSEVKQMKDDDKPEGNSGSSPVEGTVVNPPRSADPEHQPRARAGDRGSHNQPESGNSSTHTP